MRVLSSSCSLTRSSERFLLRKAVLQRPSERRQSLGSRRIHLSLPQLLNYIVKMLAGLQPPLQQFGVVGIPFSLEWGVRGKYMRLAYHDVHTAYRDVFVSRKKVYIYIIYTR